jgi:uncharacterized protein (TIGR02599 family)
MKRETPMKFRPYAFRSLLRGFTLVEVLASCAVLAILLTVLLSMTAEVQKTSRLTQGKTEQFREARVAFETITRRLSLATLNTYWDYDDRSNLKNYNRQSELRFKCGYSKPYDGKLGLLPSDAQSTTHSIFFQAPLGFTTDSTTYGGMESMINTWGYYIEFGSDVNLRPSVINTVGIPERKRFRLYELMEPAESLSLYKYTSGNDTSGNPASWSYRGMEWFQDPLNKPGRTSRVLADNIIALVFIPRDPNLEAQQKKALTSDYNYDSSPENKVQLWSENQLPPYIQVTMVAIDEQSAARLEANYGDSMPTMIKPQWFTNNTISADGKIYEDYEKDLNEYLRQQLSGKWDPKERVNYRIFTSNVAIRGAKWSPGNY